MQTKLELLTRGNVAASVQGLHAREWNSLGFFQGHREYVTTHTST
jgi:hypothetical protein